MSLAPKDLQQHGLSLEEAQAWVEQIADGRARPAPEQWTAVTQGLLKPQHPFSLHELIFKAIYSDWDATAGPAPAWIPGKKEKETSQLAKALNERGLASYVELFQWSIQDRAAFWQWVIARLGIVFHEPPESTLDLSQGVENPTWLSGAKYAIVESCFQADPKAVAIVSASESDPALQKMTYEELYRLSDRVAHSLRANGLCIGDAVALDMVMNPECVAIYLGVLKAGCVAVSIADSFAPEEIATRLRLSKAKAIFTQGYLKRGGKRLPLFEKVQAAQAPMAIVLDLEDLPLRESDMSWDSFLETGSHHPFESAVADSRTPINILFSSGTTGDPKAITWNQTTPIKCAMDGMFHHDIHPGQVVAWPTNLGWMMGPWLVFASLLNRATIALYDGLPTGEGFGKFVQDAKVAMLGLVPSLVKAWRKTDCMKRFDWSGIHVFSSTGECSNAEDYLYLMSLAGYRPVIEYCGGTEIGGGYVTGTVLQPASPATFSTPALGLSFYLLDENEKPADSGELFLVPPSIGLSTELLNKDRDHFEVYYKDTPKGPQGETLRRHGDEMERLGGDYYRGHGRADDTMNLGGIKVSSAEIERVVSRIESVLETAAIAVAPKGGGPSELVIYAVGENTTLEVKTLQEKMQREIKNQLNPLFKIAQVIEIEKLPRTASNKVMRRVLRAQYEELQRKI